MFYLGLDLGMQRDHSAIVVAERSGDKLVVRFVERVALGTPYPKVVERVRGIVRSGVMAGRCSVAVDGTGVGLPVVEMLRHAGLGCEICAVTITGGERASSRSGGLGTSWSVPKQDLIAGVQVLLEKGDLKIARGLKELGSLVKELVDVTATMGGRGQVRYGADGYEEHDDLVIALALACWMAGRKKNEVGWRRLTGL